MASGGLQERQVKDFRFALAAKIRVVDGGVDSLLSGRDYLISVCNKYDLVFIGIPNGFRIVRVADVDTTAEKLTSTRNVVESFPFHMTVPLAGPPRHLAVNSDGSILSVCVSESGACVVHFYDIQGFYDRTTSSVPFFNVKLAVGQEMIDLAWNPSVELSSVCAVCLADGSVKLMDVKDTGVEMTATLPATSRATCLCWSPKGKQIVIGKADGNLVQYDQRFVEKKCVPPASGLFGDGRPVSVLDVYWESTLVFFAVYKPVDGDSSEQPWLVAVTLSKDGSSSYETLEDVCFGCGDNINQKYFMLMIQEWSMIICTSATSAETAIVSRQLQNPNGWERWVLDDNSRAEVPMSENFEDAFPKGVGFSTASQRPVPINESLTLPPSPMLFLLSSEGLLVCYYMIYTAPSVSKFNTKPEILTGSCTRRRQVPANTVFDLSSQQLLQQSATAAQPTIAANLSSVSKPAASVQSGVQPFSQLSQPSISASLQLGGQTVSAPLQLRGQTQLSSLLSGNIPQTTQLFFGAQSQSSVAQQIEPPHTSSATSSKPSALSSLLLGTSSQPTLPVNSIFTQPSSVAALPQLSAATKALSGQPVTNAGGISAGLPFSSDSFTFGKPISQSTPAHGGLKPQLPDGGLKPQLPISQSTPAHGGLKPQLPDMSNNKSSMQPGRAPLAAVPVAAAKMAANNAPASSHSTAPAKATLITGVVQSVTSDNVIPQKVSSKRRSADTADKLYMHSIEEEITHFEQELTKMRTRSSEMSFNLGETAEKENLCRKTHQLTQVYKGVQTNIKGLNEQISDLKTRCIELFATTAQCEQLEAYEGDPSVKDLLLRQPLNPIHERKMKEIRTMNSYVEGEIGKVDCMLDDQWQEYQYEKSGRRILKTPATDVIYQTLTDNMRTIHSQKQLLDKLHGVLRKQFLHSSHPLRDLSAATDLLTEQLGKRLNVTDDSTPKSKRLDTTPNSARIDKDAQLRDALSSRKVAPVISAAPKNLTSSKIVSLRDLKEMLYVKPSAENQEVQTGNPVVQLQNRTGSLSVVPSSSPAFNLQQNNMSKMVHVSSVLTTGTSLPSTRSVTHESRLQGKHTGSSQANVLQSSQDLAARAVFDSVLQGRSVSEKSSTAGTVVQPLATAPFTSIAVSSNNGALSGKVAASKNLVFSAPPTVGQVTGFAASKPVMLSTLPAMSSAKFTSKDEKPSHALNVTAAYSGEDFNPGEDEDYEEEGDQEYEDDDEDEDEEEDDYPGDAGSDNCSVNEAAVASRVSGTSVVFKTPLTVPKPAATSSISTNVTATVNSETPPQMFGDQKLTASSKQLTTNPTSTVKALPVFSFASSSSAVAVEPGKLASTLQSSLTPPGNVQVTVKAQPVVTSEPKITPALISDTKPVAPAENIKTTFGTSSSLSLGSGLFGHKSALASGQSSFGFTGNDVSKPPAYSSGTPVFGQAPASTSAGIAVLSGSLPVATAAVVSSSPTLLFGKPVPVLTDNNTVASSIAQQQVVQSAGPRVSGEPVVSSVTNAAASSVISGLTQPSSTTSVSNALAGLTSQTLSTDPAVSVGSGTLDSATSTSATVLAPKSDAAIAGTAGLFGSSLGFGQSSAASNGQFAQGTTFATAVTGTSSAVFGQTALGSNATGLSSGLFGQAAATTTSAVSSVFGQSAASGSTGFGLFGQQPSASSSNFGPPTSTTSSVFGQPSASTTSAFGQPTPASTTGFGQPASTSSFTFGQPSSTTSLFGQTATGGSAGFGQPASGSSSIFGQPAQASSSIFGQTSAPAGSSTGFGFGGGQSSGFGSQPAFGQPAFGQPPAGSSMESGLFGSGGSSGGGLFGGLGGKPDAAKANTNVFGVSFGSSQQPTGLFGQSPAGNSGFGTVKTQANISGAFSGGGGSVESSGFGFQKTQPIASQPAGQFGSPPAFGGPAAFGSSPAFGAGATFGSPPQFGSSFGGGNAFSSPFGSQALGSGDGSGSNNAFGNSSTFAAMAQSNGPTFGSIAQQGGLFGAQQPQQQPAFGGFGAISVGAQSPFGGTSFSSPQSPASSFTSYRS